MRLALRVFKPMLASGRVAPKMRLIVVGQPGPESEKIHRFVGAENMAGRVIFVDGISDDYSDIPAFREVGSAGCRFVSLTADAEEKIANERLQAGTPGDSADLPSPFIDASNPRKNIFGCTGGCCRCPKPRRCRRGRRKHCKLNIESPVASELPTAVRF